MTLFEAMNELKGRPAASFVTQGQGTSYRLSVESGCFVLTRDGEEVPIPVDLLASDWTEEREDDEILQMFEVRHVSDGATEVVEKVLARHASEVEEALLKKSSQFRPNRSVIRSIEVVDPTDINVSDMSMGEFLRFSKMGRANT